MRANIATGLKRISTIFWGFFVLVSLLALVIGIFTLKGEPAYLGAVCAAFFYALHRATCWIIDGFQAKQQT